MAIDVFKFEIKNVVDASEFEKSIQDKKVDADNVIAVIGKTEGNGGVNDFTRMLSDEAFRNVLRRHGKRSEAEIKKIPMVWSGGCDGVITPHATVFARNGKSGKSVPDAHRDGHGDERSPDAGGYRAAGDGRKSRRWRAQGDEGCRDYRPQRRALRPDQDAAFDDRRGPGVRTAAARMSLAKCMIRWAFRTDRPASGLRLPSARSQCQKRRKFVATSISIRRLPPALRGSNSTARKSSCSAIRPTPAGATGSATA